MIWGPNLRSFLCWAVLLLPLLGCSSKQGLERLPTPLMAIENTFAAEKDWRYRLSLVDDPAHGQAQRTAITATHVYVSDDEGAVHAVALDSGQQQWQVDTGLSLSSGMAYGQGGGKALVIVGSHDGDVLALAAEDGQLIWRSRVNSEVLAPPVISDGVVVVRSIDGSLVALAAADGRRLWSYQAAVPALSLHGVSTPLIYQGRVINGLADGRLVALALEDGRVLWHSTVAVSAGRSELERLVDVDANLVRFNNTLYAAAYQGRVVAIDLRSGRLLWARDLSAYRGLAVDKDALYVVDDEDAILALSRGSGATLWKQQGLMARALTAPLLTAEHVIVADLEGYVHWLDRYEGGFLARMAVATDEPIMVLQQDDRGALYAVSQDGRLTKLVVNKD